MADDHAKAKASNSMVEAGSSNDTDSRTQAHSPLHLTSSMGCKNNGCQNQYSPTEDPCPCSRVSPKQRPPRNRRAPNVCSSRSKRTRMPTTMGFYSRKFFLVSSCFYLLSATGGGSTGVGEQGGKKRFLRTVGVVVAADAAAADAPVISKAEATGSSSSTIVDNAISSESVVTEPTNDEEDEEFDYESYHMKHHIPVPALGATMMGFMNNAVANAAADSSDSSNNPPQHRALEEEAAIIPSRGILAFAGTSEAMKSFAASEMDGDDTDERLFLDETEEDEPPPPPNNEHGNVMMYEATLAQISKSRSSLLWGSDDSTEEVDPPSIIDKQQPKLARTASDLDRGRHLVGLEVREVRPHQQIIVDYQNDASTITTSDTNDSEEQPSMRPLRIKYILSDNSNSIELKATGDGASTENGELDDSTTNLQKLLSTLLDTSFNRTAAFWSQALSLQSPVLGNIVPTVKTCGGARIPDLHREKGVENADIVIYVSGDNRFCGGALMHSSICDFDQHMRPLVSNINICTKNIPTATTDDYGVQIVTEVMNKYDGYISTETARILGASTSLFRHYHNPDTESPYGTSQKHATCVDGTQETIMLPSVIGEDVDSTTGQVYYEIRTPKVIEVVRNHFDCMTMTGARLEVKRGGLSCFGGFLDERLFFGEQVSGFQVVATKKNPQGASILISPLTLALLEDSSWYVANYTVSTELSFGRGAGCQFARVGACRVDENGVVQVSTQGKGFHCAKIGRMGCDVTHSFKAKCDLLHSTSVAFTHGMIGGDGADSSDVCPMHVRGAIDCIQGTTKDSSLLTLPGEVYGNSSKCFLTDEGHPMCLQGTCNEEKQSIDIMYEDEMFSCTRDGEIINTKKALRIECPRIAAVCPHLICPSNCSGRGVCDEDREAKHTCICDDPFDETPGCWGQ